MIVMKNVRRQQAMKRVKNILGDKKGNSMRNTMVLMTIPLLLAETSKKPVTSTPLSEMK